MRLQDGRVTGNKREELEEWRRASGGSTTRGSRGSAEPRGGWYRRCRSPHMPLAWSGQRTVLVPYTGIAWGRPPVAMQNELVTFGFPR